MNRVQDKLFLVQWALYLKRKGLARADVVLSRIPQSPTELVFILEVTVQLLILKKLQIDVDTFKIKTIVEHPLAGIELNQGLNNLLNTQYIQNLINHFYFLTSNNNPHQQTSLHFALINKAASFFISPSNQNDHSLLWNLFYKSIRWFYLLVNKNNNHLEKSLIQFKGLWSVANISSSINQDLFDLLILWQYHQYQISNKQLIQQQNSPNKLIQQWFLYIKYQLQVFLINKNNKKISITHICNEAKVMLGLSTFNKAAKRQILSTLKVQLLKNVPASIKIQQNSTFIFGYLFSIFDYICQQLQVSIDMIITSEDLIKHEFIFYFHLWNILQLSQYHQNVSFLQFMRKNSQFQVLQIYQKVSFNLFGIYQSLNKDIYENYLKENDKKAFRLFFYQPYAVSKATLEYYLKESGISIKNNNKLKIKTNRFNFNPLFYDPLHYLMVNKRFWDDHFHRKILQLSLWITLDGFSKQILVKFKFSLNQNEYLDYIKKVNLAITIFLFSLDFPTKMLQYHPVQSDTLKDLFIQPIFPALILNNPYFFKDYDWQKQYILQKSQTGIDYWVLPWSHLLGVPKNMGLYIYFQDGYKLAHKFILQQRINFDKIFGDFFISKITSQLQMLGISIMGQQAQTKQKLTFLNLQRRKSMYLLLKQTEGMTEKSKIPLKRLMQILA